MPVIESLLLAALAHQPSPVDKEAFLPCWYDVFAWREIGLFGDLPQHFASYRVLEVFTINFIRHFILSSFAVYTLCVYGSLVSRLEHKSPVHGTHCAVLSVEFIGSAKLLSMACR